MPGRSGKSVQVDVETWEKLMKLKIKYKKSVKDILGNWLRAHYRSIKRVIRSLGMHPNLRGLISVM